MPTGFGPFAFDRQSRLLSRDGAEMALPPRVLGVLEVLIARPGEIVARQDLLDSVWKDAFVTDTSLAEAVSFLRQALGDDPQSPRYIQTVHRRGYRFLAPLSPGSNDRPPSAAELGTSWALTPGGAAEASAGATASPSLQAPQLGTSSGLTPAGGGTRLVPWTVAIFATALAVSAVWYGVRQKPPDPPPVTRFEV